MSSSSAATASSSTTLDSSSSLLLPLHHEATVYASSVIEGQPYRQRRRSLPLIWSLCVSIPLVAVFFYLSSNGGGDRSLRHPLSFPKRQLSDRHIRYLTLGGRSTWGDGLHEDNMITTTNNNEDHTQHQSYPYQLSRSVHNAAQRIGGPTLASLCTQSIVGNTEVYDVIIVEFSPYEASLSLLAQRLRQRFPSATLVFVQLWSPSQFFYRDGDDVTPQTSSDISLGAWRSNQWTSGSGGKNLAAGISSAIQQHQWFYQENAEATANLKRTVQELEGYLYQLPRPASAGQALQLIPELFVERRSNSNDAEMEYTLSRKGHRTVADGIRSIVDEQKVLDRTLRNMVGTWGNGDSCQLWYETGQGVPKSTLALREFSKSAENQKYALEVPTLEGGSMTIHNPFDEDRMVYLTYMTTSASSSPNKIYPRTKVQLNNKNSVILDPYHDDNSEDRHVTRTTAIGKVPAGSYSTLSFDPMEHTLMPFRIVGASLLATEKLSHKIASEFAMSPEPAHVGEVYRRRNLDLW